MKIGITGGAGFIGSHLCKKLLSLGLDVRIIDDFSTGRKSNLLGLKVEIHEGSITNRKNMLNFSEEIDFIFHLAALGSVPRSLVNPRSTFEVNVAGSLEILEVIRERKIPSIFISSSSVYGDLKESPKKELNTGKPLSPYAASKLSMEKFVEAYRNSFDLDIMVFRLFNVFGPFQRFDHEYAAVIPKWLNLALRGETIEIYGDGSISRDFTYVEEVTNVLTQALYKVEMFREMEVINLAFGREISLNQIAKKTNEIFPRAQFVYGPKRPSDILNSKSCPDKLHEYFPSAEEISFDSSFSETAEWIMRNS